jgi:transposase
MTRRGGRRRIDNRSVLEGILWVLRSGARWKDLPKRYPSPSTCWRRLAEWEDEGIWEEIWRTFLSELDAQGRISWEEVFADATFVPAKKGAPTSARPGGAKAQSWWWWRAARVFLWEFTWTRPPRRK